MDLGTVTIGRRFLGPPTSANGGYACGRIAAFIDGPAEVTLRVPPPLETEMQVRSSGSGAVELRAGELLVGTARPTDFTVSRVVAPSFDQAGLAAVRTFDKNRHPLPTCFVCGPEREVGDGLLIHPGPVDAEDTSWSGLLAAPWIPDANLADEEGVVKPEFIWAALDCPTAYASSDAEGMRIILLGRQSVRILRRPASLSRCVITARQAGREGRKYFAEAALHDEFGRRLAECRATWIEVSREVQRGIGA